MVLFIIMKEVLIISHNAHFFMFLFPSSIKLSDLIFNSFITLVLKSKLSVVKFLCDH
jgi:hypothetical protein